jgi:hypothetical protein
MNVDHVEVTYVAGPHTHTIRAPYNAWVTDEISASAAESFVNLAMMFGSARMIATEHVHDESTECETLVLKGGDTAASRGVCYLWTRELKFAGDDIRMIR